MPRTASARPQPYLSYHNPILHSGVVSVTGTLTVDTGLNHNNFIPVLTVKGGIASLAPAHVLAWDYGTKAGTFVITVGKATSAAVTTVIAATSAINVAFVILSGASVA